jgi:hypothetical protein
MPYSYPPHRTTSTMMSVGVEEENNNNNYYNNNINNDFYHDHDNDNNDVPFKKLCHNCHNSFDNNSIVSSSEVSSVSTNNTTTSNTRSSNSNPKRVLYTYRQRRQILKEKTPLSARKMTGKNLKNLQILPVRTAEFC